MTSPHNAAPCSNEQSIPQGSKTALASTCTRLERTPNAKPPSSSSLSDTDQWRMSLKSFRPWRTSSTSWPITTSWPSLSPEPATMQQKSSRPTAPSCIQIYEDMHVLQGGEHAIRGTPGKECQKKKEARKQEHSANTRVADMNATCFMVHEYIRLASSYSSFLNPCWLDTDYPDFSLLSDLHNVDDIQDLNCLDLPSDEEMEGIEALATGSSQTGQWIFNTRAIDHMSRFLAQNSSPASATVTVAGGRKPLITRVGEASLQTSVPSGRESY